MYHPNCVFGKRLNLVLHCNVMVFIVCKAYNEDERVVGHSLKVGTLLQSIGFSIGSVQ